MLKNGKIVYNISIVSLSLVVTVSREGGSIIFYVLSIVIANLFSSQIIDSKGEQYDEHIK